MAIIQMMLPVKKRLENYLQNKIMIFVTGATGLLGRHLLKALLEKGDKIKANYRNKASLDELNLSHSNLEWVQGDVLDVTFLHKELKGIKQVIHAAAVVSFDPSDTALIEKVNVEGTKNVVDAAIENKVESFFFVSSIAAIGRDENVDIIDESTKWVESDLNTPYANSKYMAELEVFRAQEEGMNVLVVNPSIILGPGDWNKSSGQLFKFVWNNSKYYTGGTFNYVDLRDVVAIILKLMDKGVFGERYILNAGNISFRNFFKKTARAFNKPQPSLKVADFLVKLVYRIDRIRVAIFGGKSTVTKETVKLLKKSFKYDNSKIIRELGYEFINIDDSISWTCSAYVEKYKL